MPFMSRHAASRMLAGTLPFLSLIAGLAQGPAALAGEMNISQFVFRDVNRNGIYDRGEPPFAGITIRLEQEGRDPIRRQSNLAGFTNFPMSAEDAEKDITAPGPVTFAAELPEGLILTTGNPMHSARIVALPAAPGGLVMEPVNPFMGVASALTITSRSEGIGAMTCNMGQITVAALSRNGAFTCPVTPGEWTVVWDMADGTAPSRRVTVGDWPVHLPATAGETTGAKATRLSFDDLITSQNILELPSFDGFLFHNFVVAHHKFYGGWGYVNGTVSGEFSAYNSSGHAARVASDRPFGLDRVFVTAAWPQGAAYPVEFTALRDGAVVATETVAVSNLAPVLFEPRWSGIDQLVIRHAAYWQVVLDDMELSR